ncbi:cytokine receptor isoform X1 [Nilaparvata lugens]|uniref:cytokine receptor isoform X1 n=1 Tax=Nilaparvata lugens TaxID=108931 RepID=UPI00193CA8D9|nr:cytokine receptor isoform X1 [Nilaparvata lugens]
MRLAAKSVCSGGSSSIAVALLVTLALASFLGCSHADEQESFQCSTGFTTKGVTIPRGDIVLLYGNPLEMYCKLNPQLTDLTAESLVFYNNTHRMDQKHLQIINSTTLRLFIEKPEPSFSWYTCKVLVPLGNATTREENICLNQVSIGFKPKEVTNFTCLSYNWENLTCTWDISYNPVKTSYNLRYLLPSRNIERLFSCQVYVEDNVCYWNQSSHLQFPRSAFYSFRMHVSNFFGHFTQTLKYKLFQSVIPAKPLNLSFVNKTADAVTIKWEVGHPMLTFPPGLVQRVEYRSQWDKDVHWQVVDTGHLSRKSKHKILTIKGLKYPHSKYDIRVFMRSADAIGNESWSEPSTLTITTMSTAPAAPPKLTPGCFEVVDSYNNEIYDARDVYIYWQQLPERMRNGDHFSYRVKQLNPVNGEEKELVANETSPAFARFLHFPREATHLKIYSVNSEGYSKNGSYLFIPSAIDYVPEPLAFTKMLLEKEGHFSLSWKKPQMKDIKVTGYTVYWCENNNDRPYPCKGYLDWVHVSKDTFNYSITVPSDTIYQFAVSAETISQSSNLVWASCTIIRNQVSKIKNMWVTDVGSTYIVLNWKLECSDRVGQIKGYLIQYCEAKEPGSPICKDNKATTMRVPDTEPAKGNITGLNPYKTYLLSVAILMTNDEKGVFSKALVFPTLEGAPSSPPRNMSVSDVTNTSVVLTWLPPSKDQRNGVLQEYRININNLTEITVPVNGTDELDQMKPGTIVLEDLLSFTTYKVSLKACCARFQCSQYSPVMNFTTLTGKPGAIDTIQRETRNGSKVLISWNPPSYRGGPINYYELMIRTSKGTNQPINSSFTTGINKTERYVEEKCDEDEVSSTMYYYYVRAVNIGDDDNITYYGNWSKAADHSCHTKGFPKSVILIIITSFLIILIGLIGYLGKRTWTWANSKFFASLGVKLPPGLDPPKREVDKESAVFCPYKHGSLPPEKMIIDGYKIDSPPDQELLLMKKSNTEFVGDGDGDADGDGDGDGDSSGCSSAHDSVSSSITSGTHISDSGTEADHDQPPYGLISEYEEEEEEEEDVNPQDKEQDQERKDQPTEGKMHSNITSVMKSEFEEDIQDINTTILELKELAEEEFERRKILRADYDRFLNIVSRATESVIKIDTRATLISQLTSILSSGGPKLKQSIIYLSRSVQEINSPVNKGFFDPKIK